jgi:hypothetical protein
MGMENLYGCCPVCGPNDGYLDVGQEQWFYCSVHKKRGLFGFGSFGAAHRATRSGVPAQEFLADLHPVPMKRSRS